MDRRVIAILALVLIVPVLSGPAESLHTCAVRNGKWECGDPPNRPPIADAGPDRVIPESTKLILDASKSFDPDDGDDLQYEWNLIAFDFPQYVPLQECDDDCDPEDWQLAYWAPYLPPGQRSKASFTWQLTVYDRAIGTVQGICAIEDAADPGYCGDDQLQAERNHFSRDTVTYTVVNVNQPPHGWCRPMPDPLVVENLDACTNTISGPSTEDKEEPDYVHLAFEPDTVDIVKGPINEDYKDASKVTFYLMAWDDKEVTAAEVYLYPSELVDDWEKQTKKEFVCQPDVVPHKIRFGLGRLLVGKPSGMQMDPGPGPDFDDQAYRGQTATIRETGSVWSGVLAADHPRLVAGDYRVCGRAFDSEGGNMTTSPDVDFLTVIAGLDRGQSPPCLSIVHPDVEPAIIPEVPLKPTAHPVDRFDCSQPARPADNKCDVFPTQVLGIGQVVRIDARVKPFGLPQDPDFYVPHTEYLMEKVTIQNFLSGPDEVPAVHGPETAIPSPYVLYLDTLAAGTQRVIVRAYDRAGGMSEICIPVTTDVGEPEVLVRHDGILYQSVTSQFFVYLHDAVDAQSVLEIKDWEFGTPHREKLCVPPPTGLDPVSPTCDMTGVYALPPLSVFPHVDINGDGVRDVLYDSRYADDPALLSDDPTFVYDRYFDYVTQQTHVLVQMDCNGDRVKDYVENLDGDRVCDPDEPWVLGADRKKDPDNTEGIVRTAKLNGTLDADEKLMEFLANRVTWVFPFDVTPSFQLGTYRWLSLTTDRALNTLVDNGTIEVAVYEADISVVQVATTQGTPLLPGDEVNLTATFRHDSHLTRGFAEIPILYSFAETDPFAAMPGGILEVDDILDVLQMLEDGTIGMAMCLDTSVEPPEPDVCLLERGESVNATATFRFRPGPHTVYASAMAPFGVVETDPSDNNLTHRFEVYLGRTDVGKDKQYHVRADARGLPLLQDGVVDLAINRTYNMALDASGERYEWKVGNTTYYWDPDQRRDPADTRKECELDPASQTFPKQCRAITVWTAPAAEPEPKDTPAAALLVLVALLAGIAAVRRRR